MGKKPCPRLRRQRLRRSVMLKVRHELYKGENFGFTGNY
jgi:hypothetical protein